MKKTIYFNGLPITYVLIRKTVKNLNLRVKSDGIVYISANNTVSLEFIENFIIKNGERILQFIKETEEKNRDNPEKYLYENGDSVKFLGNYYNVVIKKGNENKIAIEGDLFIISLKDIENKEEKLKTVKNWHKKQTYDIFTQINAETARMFEKKSIQKAALKIRKMTTRWGSCKTDGNVITINSRLIYYPYECIQAVFIHEYAHFLHYYHDKNFYNFVLEMMPSYKKWDKILKESKWG